MVLDFGYTVDIIDKATVVIRPCVAIKEKDYGEGELFRKGVRVSFGKELPNFRKRSGQIARLLCNLWDCTGYAKAVILVDKVAKNMTVMFTRNVDSKGYERVEKAEFFTDITDLFSEWLGNTVTLDTLSEIDNFVPFKEDDEDVCDDEYDDEDEVEDEDDEEENPLLNDYIDHIVDNYKAYMKRNNPDKKIDFEKVAEELKKNLDGMLCGAGYLEDDGNVHMMASEPVSDETEVPETESDTEEDNPILEPFLLRLIME